MDLSPALLAGFVDELEKISASHGRAVVGKGRKGARPISAANLVDKHNKGTWLKKADSMGNPQDVRGDAGDDPGAAKIPHRAGETPTKGDDNVSVGQKTGMVPGANTQTSPMTSGEDLRGAVLGKLRQSGDVPSQDSSIATDQPNNRIEPRAQAFTSDPSAKRPKRGDVPTSDRNMNLVDRNDLREGTTTVTGLGQSSTNIGAFNSPAEAT